MTKKPAAKRRGSTTRGVTDGDQEVGRRLRLIRIERSMSQQDLGNILGVSFQQVQKYEKGTNRVSASRLMQMATTLNTSPHELLGWKDGNAVATIDVETYRLAKAFSGLRDEWKAPVRHLISSLMKTND